MNRSFVFLYYILLSFFWIFALPFLFVFSRKTKYKNSIKNRFFFYNPSFKNNGIWFHACSLGEVKSLEVIIKKIKDDFSISTITETGFNEAKKICSDVRYLPFEIFLPFWIKKHKTLVVVEAELWLMLFFISKKRGIKTLLINARISDKSWHKYLKFKFFYKKIFSNIDFIFAQSQKDAQRIQKLGGKNIKISGNIKTQNVPIVSKKYKKINRELIILASTHNGEEEALLEACRNLNSMIILAPRHPERFEKVQHLAEKFASKYSKKLKIFSRDNFSDCDLLLLDSMGELINFYAISDVVVLGGSFVDKIGGHNPIECAYFNNTIITGQYIFNQKFLFDKIENIYFTNFNELELLLKSNLKKSRIKNQNSIEDIIKTIKA